MPRRTDAEFLEEIRRKAETGDLEALFELGAHYDTGDIVVQDRVRASKIFKEAADRGHAHSMWIHAIELLWGMGNYAQAVDDGLKYLERSIAAGSANACVTMARLYHAGDLGVEKDPKRAAKFGAMARKLDKHLYNPYG